MNSHYFQPKPALMSLHKKLMFSGLIFICTGLFFECMVRLLTTNDLPQSDSQALPLWVVSNLKESNFVRHRLLFWRVPAGSDRLNTNSLGLRGLEFSPLKEPGVFRIITLGDSCTWGFGVEQTYEYPWLLQKILNMQPVPIIFEVQNAGIPGYSSLQGLRYLRSELVHYEPDVVTVYFGRNDRRRLNEEGGYLPDHEVMIPPVWVHLAQNILNQSRAYQLCRNRLLKLKSKPMTQPQYQKVSNSHRQFRVEQDEFKRNFLEIISTIRSIGAVPLAITAPVFPKTIGNYNTVVQTICNEHDIWCLDAEAEFFSHGGNEWLVDDCHPNETGHRWIATQLQQRILSMIQNNTVHITNISARQNP